MFNIFNNKANVMTQEDIILSEIKEFATSNNRKWMMTGDRYYRVDNDINRRKIVRHLEDGGVEVDETKANNKLAHAFTKNMVDEKVAYLLSKDYTLESDNTAYLNKAKEALGKDFQYQLINLGEESSNKGISWLHPYIDEQGIFKTMIIPTEQCIPLWKDSAHTELDAFIRFYDVTVYEGKEKKRVTKVEYYTKTEIMYYIMDKDNLIPDIEANQDPKPHYVKGNEGKGWGKVPFVAFKNNRIEYPDIRFVKSLIDDYDKSRSDVSNFLEEVKNLIYVLKGYAGTELDKFMKDLNYFRAIILDADESAGVDTLNPTIDIQATKEHYEQLKRDINEFGQSVTKDLDKFGSSPSGIALKFLYSGLDLKCNKLEREFKRAFQELLYFVDIYLSETSQGTFKEEIKIIFNRDVKINETEAISNCQTSKDTISDETIMANHPWVDDVEAEKEKLKQQKKDNLKAFGSYDFKQPVEGGNSEE